MENKKDKIIILSCLKDARNDDSAYKLEISFGGVKVELYEGEGAMELYKKMLSHWSSLDNFLHEVDVKPYGCDYLIEGKSCSLKVTGKVCDKIVTDKTNPADTTYVALYLGLAGAVISGNSDYVGLLGQTLAVLNQSPKIMVDKNGLEQMKEDMRA